MKREDAERAYGHELIPTPRYKLLRMQREIARLRLARNLARGDLRQHQKAITRLICAEANRNANENVELLAQVRALQIRINALEKENSRIQMVPMIQPKKPTGVLRRIGEWIRS